MSNSNFEKFEKDLEDLEESVETFKDHAKSRGTGFLTLLAVLFIGLKLGGVITWSWWWVLSPIWIPLVVIILAAIFLMLGYAIISKKKDKDE